MKKLLTIFLTSAFLISNLSFSFAQTNAPGTPEEGENGAELEILQDETEEAFPIEEGEEKQNADTQEDESREEQGSLAEQLETEEIQPTQHSFWTILGAILIPSTFLVIAYFILKFFQT